MEISIDEIKGYTESEAWDNVWEKARDEFGVNSCDICGLIENSIELIWIDTEDFKPLDNDSFNQDKYKKAIADGNSALCENCYKEKCCD